MVTVPVILAGGIGERFWPLSRSSSPKQLLKLAGSKTMLEETLRRVSPLRRNPVKPLIITGKTTLPKIQKILHPDTYDCITEPVGKNTAPAILLAAAWIEKKYGPSVMAVFSADHSIRPKTEFLSAVRTAVRFARVNDALVIFGITPTRPEPGYGYLRVAPADDSIPHAKICRVKQFIEKPSRERARRFSTSDSYLWNCGMFVWKTTAILQEFDTHLHEFIPLVDAVRHGGFSRKSINRYYRDCDNISIDYGIMERSNRVYAVIGSFLWDDVGSWEAMSRIHDRSAEGVTAVGKNIVEFECANTILFNGGAGAITAIGLNDTAVIATGDALLVAHRSKLPDLKKYLSRIKKSSILPRALF